MSKGEIHFGLESLGTSFEDLNHPMTSGWCPGGLIFLKLNLQDK